MLESVDRTNITNSTTLFCTWLHCEYLQLVLSNWWCFLSLQVFLLFACVFFSCH